jgi:hypothetical protein
VLLAISMVAILVNLATASNARLTTAGGLVASVLAWAGWEANGLALSVDVTS